MLLGSDEWRVAGGKSQVAGPLLNLLKDRQCVAGVESFLGDKGSCLVNTGDFVSLRAVEKLIGGG